MSAYKDQNLVNAKENMTRAVWAMNLSGHRIINGSTNFKTLLERDIYVNDCICKCQEDLKLARKRYMDRVRYARIKGDKKC